MARKIVLALLVLISLNISKIKADEGMWLPMLIDRLNYVDMQKEGLHLTAEEIYSVNHSSLKDAIIQFAGGCTGEIISADGLIITNHHCGYGAIQANSTVEHDYLKNGFWAMNKSQELRSDGVTARFLVRIEDVTKRVLSQLSDTMSEATRNKKVDELAKQIQDEAVKGTHYEASVKAFFNGNEYYLFVYETFRDVRLVGTPPESLGKFGGDTDNWMWPRHTCDFSMFRVYTAPDGSPADYSADNVPMKSKYFLPVSIKGKKANDFTMIMGYPGRTDRFLTSYGVKMAIDISGPTIVKIREKKLAVMKEDMNTSEAIRLQYAAKYAGTSNYWKFFIGQTRGLKRLKIYDKKVETEKQFTNWLNADAKRKAEYGTALDNISKAYAEITKYMGPRIYLYEGLFSGTEVFSFAHNFQELYKALKAAKPDKAAIAKMTTGLKASAEKYFKDYNYDTDKKLLTAMLTMYCNDVPKEQQVKVIKDIASKYDNKMNRFADKVFDNSIFVRKEKVMEFLNEPKLKTIEKDIAFTTMKDLFDYADELKAKMDKSNALLDKGNRAFVKGIMEMQPDKKFYPNANSTMRLTYGKVLDYYPADAVHYDYVTTLKGVMEKEDPTNDEFIVPEKLKQLYEARDFGRYAEDGKLVTCFLTNNDITGGNSGSPVINADGQLIGLAFDGNWEAMSGNIAFEPDLQRTICVDIRYVLFIIEKYAGATNLINEMSLVTAEAPKPELMREDNNSAEKPMEPGKITTGKRINTAKDDPTNYVDPSKVGNKVIKKGTFREEKQQQLQQVK